MKKVTTFCLWALPLMALFLSFGVQAQENAVIYTIANDVQINSKQLEFDLLLLDPDATQPFEEATVQAGILVNPAIYAGGTLTCQIVAGTSNLNSTQIPTSVTFTQASNVIKLASKAPPGCGGGTIISTDPNNRTRVIRLRLTNTVDFAAGSFANLTFCFTTTPYPTKTSFYQAADCINTAAPVSATNVYSMALNLPLNAPSCVAPLAFAVTGGGSYCSGGVGLPVGLAGSEADVVYTLYNGGIAQVPTVSGTGAAITFGNQLAGAYTVVGTRVCPVLPNLTTLMIGGADVWEIPSSTVEFTASACDSYTWALNGVTYTASGDYTFVDGCVTNILHLTITPSSTVEFTESACDSYTWALNGVTYTASGDYTFVVGCVTNILHLTITPTVTPTFTQLGPYTQGDVPGVLAGTSIEGITGSWSPATISTATVGSDVYTFTPDAGQCATGTTMTIVVNAIPCFAVETWNGSVNNDWFNTANWTPAALPCATSAVIVPAVATNYPTLLAPASCVSITVESGASFIGSEYLSVGNALVKQDFPLTGYHYISSPVQMTTFNNVFPLAQNAVWAYIYDEASGNWMNQTIANTLAVGTGYSVNMTTPQTALFAGQLNQNPVFNTLSDVNTSGIPSRVGWNLLGNPFSSSIMWDAVVKIGTDGAVYVWNGSAYVSYNAGIGALTGGIIPSVNGFFVKANVNNATVIVPFEARVHSNIPFYKESIANLLSLKAEANNYSDETFVNFNESASAAYDGQFDAYKLQNIAEAPALYSMITGDILSINALPMEGNEVVDLGFKCGVNGTYSITANGMESFDATTPVWLEDLKTGTMQNLRTNPSYSFSYTTDDNEKHFKLHFKSANDVPANTLSGINIYSASRTVVINNTTTLAGEVKIYDLAGRELTHTSMNSQNETRIPVNYAVGTYLVKVITENGVASNKVFIR